MPQTDLAGLSDRLMLPRGISRTLRLGHRHLHQVLRVDLAIAGILLDGGEKTFCLHLRQDDELPWTLG